MTSQLTHFSFIYLHFHTHSFVDTSPSWLCCFCCYSDFHLSLIIWTYLSYSHFSHIMPFNYLILFHFYFIYLLSLLTPYLVLKPHPPSRGPLSFSLRTSCKVSRFTWIILIWDLPLVWLSPTYSCPCIRKRADLCSTKYTIGVFHSPSSNSDSTHSVYFPAEDPPLDSPQTSEPWELPISIMSNECMSALEQALSDLEARLFVVFFFTIAIYCFVYNWIGDLAAIWWIYISSLLPFIYWWPCS